LIILPSSALESMNMVAIGGLAAIAESAGSKKITAKTNDRKRRDISPMSTPGSDPGPVGEIVEDTSPSPMPAAKEYTGEYVSLRPVEPPGDVDELFENSHGSDEKERIWTYMPYGPFAGKDEMLDWLAGCKAATDMIFFTVTAKKLNQRVGMMSILNIIPPMKTLELGNIWYAPVVIFLK
jgi:hypothetical protein